MMPMKRFVHESVTKAELGISKAKDDGYISGMEENLQDGNIRAGNSKHEQTMIYSDVMVVKEAVRRLFSACLRISLSQ